MKKTIRKTLLISTIVLFLPFILTIFFSTEKKNNLSLHALKFDIYYEQDGSKEWIDLDHYLIGSVAATMPAGYYMDALKAQAIIQRTYTLYNVLLLQQKYPSKTEFSTSELGLPYLSLKDLEQYWEGESYTTYFSKLENAVMGTKHLILTYKNQLILPVFFETGNGTTRSALDAWGKDVPYLQSVSSKQDITSIHYLKITEYDPNTLGSILSAYYEEFDYQNGSFFESVLIQERDTVGYVTKVQVGDMQVSGEEFAKVLNINSSNFYIEHYNDNARIICTGVGHGIGLSQYGANAMAQEGSSYEQILHHYYRNIDIVDLSK